MKTKQSIMLLTIALTNNLYAQSLPTTLPNPPKDLNIVMATAPLQIPSIQSQQNASLQFSDITISNLMKVVFSEVMSVNYVLSTKIIQDDRPISFRFNPKKDGKIEVFFSNFVRSLGYNLSIKNGVYYVEEPAKKTAADYDYFVYTPKYRTADYLAELVKPYFSEYFTASNRGIDTPTRTPESLEAPTGSALAMGNKSYDILSFRYDDPKIKNKILNFLNQADTPEKNIIIKAYVYEVSYTDQDGSALGLMANIAHSKLNMQLGAINPLDNYLKFSSNALSMFVSNLANDNRVKLVSNQQFRVKNKEEASFKSGQKIPTLGSVSYQGSSGTPVQNIEKVDTGSIIKATPTIKKNAIDINFYQEISEAVTTTTGLNNTPTIQQRTLNTNITTKENEVVILAGLTQIKKTSGESQPFFLPFFKTTTTLNSKTDIVIFLEVLPASNEELPEKIGKEFMQEE